MQTPEVSFIVPCYKLAHLLPECVYSILTQTWRDLEVLIMDDCSPDDTAEVARSFADSRVQHVRNDPNLGHLRNYNKGITMSRGKYVWLISADDYLRQPYVLQKYVGLLEANPRVGYVYCPAVGVKDGAETQVLPYSATWAQDRIVGGHRFLKKLLMTNMVPAASALARRECYEKVSLFPLDMPWCGDWYLWSLFAFHYDVGYFAEPMVCYREHSLAMTNLLIRQKIDACSKEEISIPWAVRKRAVQAGFRDLLKPCLIAAANAYARTTTFPRFRNSSTFMRLGGFETSLCEEIHSEAERNWVRARVYAGFGDELRARGELAKARECYERALTLHPWLVRIRFKRMLVSLGGLGDLIWRSLRSYA